MSEKYPYTGPKFKLQIEQSHEIGTINFNTMFDLITYYTETCDKKPCIIWYYNASSIAVAKWVKCYLICDNELFYLDRVIDE